MQRQFFMFANPLHFPFKMILRDRLQWRFFPFLTGYQIIHLNHIEIAQ